MSALEMYPQRRAVLLGS